MYRVSNENLSRSEAARGNHAHLSGILLSLGLCVELMQYNISEAYRPPERSKIR